MSRNLLAVLFISIITTIGCKMPEKADAIIVGYDLSKPEKFLLPESLLEVSGIAFHNGNSDTVYAVQDEDGKLFRLGWNVKKQLHTKFSKKGDYEDVTIMNNKVFILKSNGTIFSFPLAEALYEQVDSVKEFKHLLPEGEYESLYGDEASGMLYVLCKNCKGDKKRNSVVGYVLQSADSAFVVNTFEIPLDDIKMDVSNDRSMFRASALSKNVLTGEWFIVSAVNKLIVVLDENWKVKETCQLSSNSFNQPEGLAFDKEGNLYISNEGDDLSQGNIMKFKRNAN